VNLGFENIPSGNPALSGYGMWSLEVFSLGIKAFLLKKYFVIYLSSNPYQQCILSHKQLHCNVQNPKILHPDGGFEPTVFCSRCWDADHCTPPRGHRILNRWSGFKSRKGKMCLVKSINPIVLICISVGTYDSRNQSYDFWIYNYNASVVVGWSVLYRGKVILTLKTR
jgi:hypothetical protein